MNLKPSLASQGVNITGFDLPEFRAAVDAIHDLEVHFSRENLYKAMVNEKITGQYREWKYLKLSNRFFTRRPSKGESLEDEIELEKSMDPEGRLEALQGTEWYHSEENRVRYVEMVSVQDK